VFVTHDQEEAMVLSDRVAVMRHGELQQLGPPMEVYRQPANLFVASFIGSPAMNFFEVETARQDGHLICQVGDSTLALPPDAAGSAVPSRAILGVRPMDLVVGAERGIAIQGEVFLVEPIGPISYVDVDVGGQAVKAVADPDQAPAIGERVTLGCAAARVHLFDPTSEARL
jgi:multiple sugar transport system ATP-binding protein